tara:strand:+ start:3857 stop:7408 length:3552 start_codon:yes stop_codon:yes gene_type:complete
MAVDLTRFIQEPDTTQENNPLYADLLSPQTKTSPTVNLTKFTDTPESPNYTIAPDPYLPQQNESLYNTSLPRGYSLTDLEKDPEFAMRAQRFLEGVGRNENIFEYLRDENFSLSAAFVRSTEAGDWTEAEKEDYIYLRDKFNNANLKGFKERFNLVKDMSVDVLADPLNILAGLFAVPTLGGSIAGRGALQVAGQSAVKKLTTSQLAKRGALYGAAEGMAWAGPHEFFLQDIDVDLGMRDEYDLGSIAGMTAAGGAFGGLIGGAVGGGLGLYGNRYLSKEYKHTNENLIDDVASSQNRKEIVEDSELEIGLASTKNKLNVVIANTFGKPTAWFQGYVDKSPKLKQFLKDLRYDYDTTLTSQGEEGVKRQSFGLFMGETIGKYQYGLAKSLNVLYRVGWRARLDREQNKQLVKMLQDKTLTLDSIDKVASQYDDALVTAYKGIRETLDKAFDDATAYDLFGPDVRKTAGYFPRLFKYDVLEKNKAQFKDIVVKSGHADILDEPQMFQFIEEGTDEIKKGILRDAKDIDQEIFGRNFVSEATNGKIKKLKDATPEQIADAKILKADAIVENMLEYRWTPFELRSKGQANNAKGFLQERVFRNIKDEDIAEFLEDDAQQILETYFTNTGQAIARSKYFGRTMSEFEEKTIKPMRKELEASGMTLDEANKVIVKVRDTHRKVTGLEQYSESTLKQNKWARGMADWGKLSQQMAHLPFATLSSVTEPFLLLSRAGLKDSPGVIKDIAGALVKEGNSILDRSFKGIQRGVFGKKTTGVKDIGMPSQKKGASIFDTMDDDTWGELYKTGLALEQAVQERIEGLAGEGMYGSWAKAGQAAFFKVNLLTQWTKAVQLASFTTGKRLIKTNAKRLSEGGLSKSNKKYLTQQLNDLGIDGDEAVAWYRGSLKNGKFDDSLAKAQDFYEGAYTSGANRFTKEIILNPSTAEANRPLWFSHPAAQLLVQFAGYPTVFNNTILKRFSNEAINSPMQSIPKALPTVLLMSAVAHIGNTIRSNGNNLTDYETGMSKNDGELIGEAVRRWGGFGPFDYQSRWMNESERNVGAGTATLKAFAGPLPQDVIDMVLYRKGFPEVVATNLPGYSAYDLVLGEGFKKELRSSARGTSSSTSNTLKPGLGSFSKGGFVTNVANASSEPDEKKMRGVNVTYAEAGGVLAQDKEDRILKVQMEGLGLK